MLIDTHIPLWQLLTASIAIVATLAVALYRINKYDKYHFQHFAHAINMELHQTKEQRETAAMAGRQELASHVALDEQQFHQIRETMQELKQEFRDGQTRINQSILDLTAALGKGRR